MFFDELLKFDKNIAVIDEEQQNVDYVTLHSLCEGFGEFIPSRSLIFLDINNSLAGIIAYLSCLRKNAVAALFDNSLNLTFLYNNIELYKPQFVFSERDLNFKIVTKLGKFNLYKTSELEIKLNPDLGLLLSTSGSTGSPKFVKLTYANLQANAASISQYLPILSSDITITTLPISYSYGLSIINSHLLCGASIILNDHSIISEEFWKVFNKYQPVSFGGVPYTYKMLQRIGFEKMNLPSLKYLTQAGGKVDPSLQKYLYEVVLKKNFNFYLMYGQTEATARISYLNLNENLNKIGSIGKAIPGGSLYLLDENKQIILSTNTIGELIYSGDNIMLGYSTSLQDLAVADELHGILPTGDIGYIDDDGFYYISGRTKRLIKLMGKRFSLDELESIINSEYSEVICHGNDDVLIIGLSGEFKDKKKLQEFIFERFSIHHSIIKFCIIKELKRNAYGKILYNETFAETEPL